MEDKMTENMRASAPSQPMEAVVVEPEDIRKIRLLQDLKWGSRRIAEELGLSRNTVRRYVRLGDDDPLKDLDFDHPTPQIRPDEFLVKKRSPVRQKRRFCKRRRGHTAFGKMPGTQKYLKI